MTYIYDDSESTFLLSPSYLVYGRRIVNSPNGQFFEVISTNKSSTRKLRHHRKLLEDYARENSYAKTKRNFWKLAKVKELLQGEDGMVRAAEIKTCSDITNRFQLLRRSVKHLIPLVRSSLPVVNESNPALKPKEDMEILPRPGRTRRYAAIH